MKIDWLVSLDEKPEQGDLIFINDYSLRDVSLNTLEPNVPITPQTCILFVGDTNDRNPYAQINYWDVLVREKLIRFYCRYIKWSLVSR